MTKSADRGEGRGGGGAFWSCQFHKCANFGHAKSVVEKNSLCKKYFHKTPYTHTDAIVTR